MNVDHIEAGPDGILEPSRASVVCVDIQILLGNPALCVSRLGPPLVSLDRLIDWTARWVGSGGRSLDKPTRFEATDGRF